MQSLCRGNFIGLSVNDTVLRAVVVDMRKKKITSFVEQPVKESFLDGGSFLKPNLFKTALNQLIHQDTKKPHCISISLPERYALTRELSFPAITDSEIEEAVKWQARNIFPLPLEDMYIDWKVVGEEGENREVFVVALPKKLVEDLVSITNDLNLHPVNIQTSATSLGRILPKSNKDQILININRDGTTATLVVQNLAKLTSTNRNAADREDYSEIIKTIKRLLDFYQAKLESGIEIEKVWLTGERASDKIKEKIESEFKLSVDYLRLPVSLSNKDKALAFSEAVAIALAPIAPPSSSKTINLLPRQIQEYYDIKKNFSQITNLSTAFLSLLFFGLLVTIIGYFFLFYQAYSLSAETKSAAYTLEQAQSQTQDNQKSSVEVTLLKLNKDTEKLLTLAEKKKTPKNILSNLPSILPKNINISSWQFNSKEGVLVLNGITDTRDTLLNFQQNLEQKPEFKSATIPLESLEKKYQYSFSIKIELSDK